VRKSGKLPHHRGSTSPRLLQPCGLLVRYLPLAVGLLLTVSPTLDAQTRAVRTVSADGAAAALAAARAEASKRSWTMSIAIVDPAGDLLAFHRMDGASPASIQNALGKARTAARFRRPTQVYDSLIANGRPGLLNFENMTPLEGGTPLLLDGVVVGAIGVSGGTSAEDAVIARAGVSAVKP
jgi:glc operon protein GlcG